METMRSVDLRRRWVGWFVITLLLLVAPTTLGRGMLLLLIEGPCPPDCAQVDESDERPSPASEPPMAEEHVEVDHVCAWQAHEDHCPPDCGDCTCCATPIMAVVDLPVLTFGMLEAFQLDWRGPPGPVRLGARRGLYRPPKRPLATTTT